jgi:hypothetical protein
MAVRMSMTEQEAAYEEFIDDLYRQWEAEYSQEIKNRGVEEYLGDLLKSYYFSNTQIAQIPLRRIREAESLLGTNASASLALGYSAIEIGFKNLILRPMVTGFIHETSVASLIAEIVSEPLQHRTFFQAVGGHTPVCSRGRSRHADRCGAPRYSLGPYGANQGTAKRGPASWRGGYSGRSECCAHDCEADN